MALTLTQIRQRLGIELRGFRNSTATSGSTTQTLVDTRYPYKSNRRDGAYTDFTDWWLFRPSATATGDQQRRVLDYHPPTGTFLPDGPYTASPASEVYELWSVGLELDELHDAINHALTRIFVTDRFWLVPPTDDLQQSFLRLPPPTDVQDWLTNARWVLSVGSLTEPARTTASLSARLFSSAAYAGVIACFKRDRSQGIIRRIQSTTANDDLLANALSMAATQVTSEGNLLVLAVSVYGSAITTPSGWTLIGSATQGSVLTSLYYRFPTSHGSGVTNFTVSYTGSSAVGTLAEYSGLLPGGLDVSATANGTSITPTSGTTSQVAQGDELWIAVLGANAASAGNTQLAPTNRFTRVANPSQIASNANIGHGFYERNIALTDLQEREPSPVEGRQFDPSQEESGQVYIYPASLLSPPSAYVVEARRSLYTMARVDSSGQFGTKLTGLTAEGNQVDGDKFDHLLDIVVAGAITEAYERYPTFRELAEGERLARIELARRRFLIYEGQREVAPREGFRYREPVG